MRRRSCVASCFIILITKWVPAIENTWYGNHRSSRVILYQYLRPARTVAVTVTMAVTVIVILIVIIISKITLPIKAHLYICVHLQPVHIHAYSCSGRTLQCCGNTIHNRHWQKGTHCGLESKTSHLSQNLMFRNKEKKIKRFEFFVMFISTLIGLLNFQNW